jgi:hypothetical protein
MLRIAVLYVRVPTFTGGYIPWCRRWTRIGRRPTP